MTIKDIVIRTIKFIFRKITCKKFLAPECDCDRQSSNDKIFELLNTGKPCMISRFGTTEINCINNYICVHSNKSYLKKIWDYVSDKTHTPWWNKSHFEKMSVYSGIFPVCQDTAERFSERYLDDIPEIDLLGCHQYYEKFMPLREDVIKVQLEMLYPFYVERPWTRYLKGKKVLVIHPFEETIKQQYAKRELLFDNAEILPEFDIITYKPVQSIAGGETEYASWFEALAHMEEDICKIGFDVAIIGCGAYGLPLAAHVKRMGKQAIHLGGGTQLLFGILGKRWVEQYKEKRYWHYRPGVDIDIDHTTLFNESWCYPLDCDRPKNAQKVENGCYWR